MPIDSHSLITQNFRVSNLLCILINLLISAFVRMGARSIELQISNQEGERPNKSSAVVAIQNHFSHEMMRK